MEYPPGRFVSKKQTRYLWQVYLIKFPHYERRCHWVGDLIFTEWRVETPPSPEERDSAKKGYTQNTQEKKRESDILNRKPIYLFI